MNQILEEVSKTKKNGASETTILADTNVLLRLGQDIDSLNKNGWRIAVTTSILLELRKKDQALYFYACANFEVINDHTEKVASEAAYIYTHQPDNLIIAAAKVNKLRLVSYDRVLLKIAAYQGVDACLPEQLIQSKHIIDRAQGGI
jgi:predicted nucleic acid-binding protein